MKSKCKTCGKKHRRTTLYLMTATVKGQGFCSSFCENVYRLAGKEGDKLTAKIKVEYASDFKVGDMISISGEPVIVEAIKGNVMEISKYQPTI